MDKEKELLTNITKRFSETFDYNVELECINSFSSITKNTHDLLIHFKKVFKEYLYNKTNQFESESMNQSLFECFIKTVYDNLSDTVTAIDKINSQFLTMLKIINRPEFKNRKINKLFNRSLTVQNNNAIFPENRNTFANCKNKSTVDINSNNFCLPFNQGPSKPNSNILKKENLINSCYTTNSQSNNMNNPFKKPNSPIKKNMIDNTNNNNFKEIVNVNKIGINNMNQSNNFTKETLLNKSEINNNNKEIKNVFEEKRDSNVNQIENYKKFEDREKQYDEQVERIINEKTEYRFIKLISRGGFANVYECIKGSEKYALKIIKLEKSEENLKGYDLEKEILSDEKTKHPNIIKMLNYIHEYKIYVLEYVEYSMRRLFLMNKDYKELLKDKEIVFLIIAQIVNALDHLYDNNYCHRDLKLDNILISSETYQIKLIDFNTAKYVTGTNLTCTIINSGATSNYNRLDYDCGTKEKFDSVQQIYYKDIYSLGVIIYSLVTQQVLDDKFNYIFALYSNSDIMFKDILIKIFDKKDFTIKDLIKSSWYESNLKAIKPELDEIKNECDNNLIDPFSVLLKKRIDVKMNKEDEFLVDF